MAIAIVRNSFWGAKNQYQEHESSFLIQKTISGTSNIVFCISKPRNNYCLIIFRMGVILTSLRPSTFLTTVLPISFSV